MSLRALGIPMQLDLNVPIAYMAFSINSYNRSILVKKLSINSSPSETDSRNRKQAHQVKEEKDVKQKICLDNNGRPMEKMAKNFHKDIVSFARELDPNGNWDKQTQEARENLENCIYMESDIVGPITEVSHKFLKSKCNMH